MDDRKLFVQFFVFSWCALYEIFLYSQEIQAGRMPALMFLRKTECL